MTHRMHACGRPDHECICITEQELADASPNVQRIVRNAIALMNDQERRAQVPVTNCDSQEYEDADEYEEADEDASPATNELVGEVANLDMIPPLPQYADDERDRHRDLTVNRERAEMEAAWKAERRRLWGAE